MKWKRANEWHDCMSEGYGTADLIPKPRNQLTGEENIEPTEEDRERQREDRARDNTRGGGGGGRGGRGE